MINEMINLNDPRIMDAVAASERWGKQRDYVRTIYNKYPERFPEGSIRKFGKAYVVTEEGMNAVTGKNIKIGDEG
jgi:hypothetical protein